MKTRGPSFAPVWLLLILSLLQGCTQWNYELGQPLAAAADTTGNGPSPTLRGLLQAWGPPQRVAADSDGYLLAWEYWHIRETTVGLSLGALGADFLSVDWGTARARGEFLLVALDNKRQVISSTRSNWDSDAGGGKSLQPLAGLFSIVDVSDLVGPLSQHRWGGAALQSLPRSLNNASRQDMGQSGLEQRGTPGALQRGY